MNCDICGREIQGQAFKVRVEGAKMLVCHRCQQLGQPYQEDAPSVQRIAPQSPGIRVTRFVTPKKTARLPKEMDELEVADDFAERISKRRTKLALSQEELAKRVKEKLSVIQHIETGKMTPDTRLCRALEHELHIKLLVPIKEATLPKSAAPAEVTLGDIVRVKGKPNRELPI